MIATAGLFSWSHRLANARHGAARIFARRLSHPQSSRRMWALAGLGGAMLYRAISGFCPIYHFLGLADREHAAIGVAAGQGAKCEETVEVDGPPSEVFAFLAAAEQFADALFSHLESVVESEGRRSHWTAIGPLNRRVEWDAEIIQ
jgi:uncharacterized membrane protein